MTADVKVLATLFPPKERHMVICSGELDAADLRLQRELEGEEVFSSDEEDDASYNNNASESSRSRTRSRSGGSRDSASSSYRCLQIDLRGFGLGTTCSASLPS